MVRKKCEIAFARLTTVHIKVHRFNFALLRNCMERQNCRVQ